jgi:hypothetical protein
MRPATMYLGSVEKLNQSTFVAEGASMSEVERLDMTGSHSCDVTRGAFDLAIAHAMQTCGYR